MFSLRRDQLLLSLKPAAQFRPVPPAADRRAWEAMGSELQGRLALAAERALHQQIAPLTASMYLAGAPFTDGYAARREQLCALILGACAQGPTRYIGKIADLLWALLEQSFWTDPAGDGELPFESAPIDLAAAQTASSLALAHALLKPELDAVSPALCRRISLELRRRIFAPLCAESALALGQGELPIALSALLCAVLLTEQQEDHGRWLCMRWLTTLLERHLRAMPEGAPFGLERHVLDMSALSDCLFMISLVSGGEVELRDEPAFVKLAMLPAMLHIGGGWFLNPNGESARPDLDPTALFRLGEGVRSDELCALSAYLLRAGAEARLAQGPLLQRLLGALYNGDFLREPVRMGLRPSCCLPDMQLMFARADWFFLALLGGPSPAPGGHLGVGDLCIFYDGKPIIIDPGDSCEAQMHSVPCVGGIEQAALSAPPPEGVDFRADPGYTLLSLGIGHAYPKKAGILGWQRSLMLTGFEGAVRLMDVVDFEQGMRRTLQFRLLTPIKPELSEGELVLGPVALSFEGPLLPEVQQVALTERQRALWGDEFYRICFTTTEPVQSGTFAFVFRPL